MSLRLRPFRAQDETVAVAADRAFAREDFTFLLGYNDDMPWLEWIRRAKRGSMLAGIARRTRCMQPSWQLRSMVRLSAVLPYGSG